MTGHQINDNKFYYIYRSTKMHTTTRAGVNVYILIYFLLSCILFFVFFVLFLPENRTRDQGMGNSKPHEAGRCVSETEAD